MCNLSSSRPRFPAPSRPRLYPAFPAQLHPRPSPHCNLPTGTEPTVTANTEERKYLCVCVCRICLVPTKCAGESNGFTPRRPSAER